MGKTMAVIIAAGFMILIALGSNVGSSGSAGPGLMTMHLTTLPPDKEQEFLSVLNEYNQLFSKLGYPNVRYRLWKVSGKQAGEYAHMWQSFWPSRAVYDKVHENEAYKKLAEKYRAFGEATVKAEVYNHYVELEPAPKKK